MNSIPSSILYETICKRPEESHKGVFGKVALIGGNQEYGGAIIMSSQACVYSGAGLVTVITHPKNHTSLHARLPEAMVVDWFNLPHVSQILATMDVIVIGPGLGLEDHGQKLLKQTLSELFPNQYCIVDGSAITLLAEETGLISEKENLIFTPHQKEWERLSQLSIQSQTLEQNLVTKKRIPGTVVLKKHRTEIYTRENKVWQNPIGTPAMATGGMGDTLAGMIAGFVAQFQNFEKAILSAVYLHSQIGETLGTQQYVVLPTQLIQQIPYFMKAYSN